MLYIAIFFNAILLLIIFCVKYEFDRKLALKSPIAILLLLSGLSVSFFLFDIGINIIIELLFSEDSFVVSILKSGFLFGLAVLGVLFLMQFS